MTNPAPERVDLNWFTTEVSGSINALTGSLITGIPVNEAIYKSNIPIPNIATLMSAFFNNK